MVTVVTVPRTIQRALNYNEQKVQKGNAECIYAHDFLNDPDKMNFYDKLHRFEQQNSLNTRATTNTLHVSLNFDPSEKLSKEKIIEIAKVYMEKIGFGDQPYLVYIHYDAGHPHMHIVATNIKKDGKRISLHNIGRNQSTKARREIEQMYNLVKAEDQKKKTNLDVKPLNAQRVHYGKAETKRSITNVLDHVLDQYKYSSLAELNAILKLYNIVADRGKEEGIIYKKRGLVFRVMDEKGNKVGVPVKASSIYSKPTLDKLEKKFAENENLKPEFKKSLKTTIDWIMLKPPKDLEAFRQALQKEKISLVIRQNEAGQVYGLTYIDHENKTVFNGSDIGKEYSAKAIQEKLGNQRNKLDKQITTKPEVPDQNIIIEKVKKLNDSPKENIQQTPDKTLDILTGTKKQYSQIPYEFRRKKKRGRNK